MTDSGSRCRVAAAQVLVQVWQGRSLKAALQQERIHFDDGRDRALLEAMCLGAVRHRRQLEFALTCFLEKSLEKQDLICHCLLLAGLVQLHILQLPAHAAVSATVEAAKDLSRASRAGLINAILRRSLREGLPESEHLAVRENHPDWLMKRLQNDWPGHWPAIVAANNQQAPLCLRVPGAAQVRTSYVSELQAQGIEVIAPAFPPQALRLQRALSPTQLPGWEDGRVSVQDLSAQCAAEALAVRPGETAWDMCAAPGGKAAQLAEAKPAYLLLTDIDADRLDSARHVFERLQCMADTVDYRVCDATKAMTEIGPGHFDAILLDAPCSATGIIRRQPDVKWHRREKDIDALNTLQWQLLKNAWHHLKPGGRLLYSTCSVLKAENERLLQSFVKQHADASELKLPEIYGMACGIGRQRFPEQDGGDGFYYALLHKA